MTKFNHTTLSAKKSVLATALLAMFSLPTIAAPDSSTDTYTTKSGTQVTPSLSVDAKYDDNIYNQTNNETSSAILIVAPAVNFKIDNGINYFSFDVGLNAGTYAENSDDNYVDGDLGVAVHIENGKSHRFDFTASIASISEQRGSGLSEGAFDPDADLIRYSDLLLTATYEYGMRSTQARIAFTTEAGTTDYSNNNVFATADSNVSNNLLGTTFYYNTNAFTEVSLTLNGDYIRYDTASLKDSDVYNALLGLKWQSSSVITLDGKLGFEFKQFENTAVDDFDGLTWDIGAKWQPLRYTSFYLSTTQASQDPDSADGSYLVERDVDLSWVHAWSSKVDTSLAVTYQQDEYENEANNRLDEYLKYTAAVDYSFTQWLDASLYAEMINNDSNQQNISYDKFVTGLNLTFTL